ncbi:MAG TPA: DUF6194 family protein [Candidatus Dormibacteraeota bacterium]|nr:DUF6194 family protein [Candidatus Dormibacteraeota bacterium]
MATSAGDGVDEAEDAAGEAAALRPLVHTAAAMDQEAIRDCVAAEFPGVDIEIGSQERGSPEVAWGDTFFIYDPNREFEGSRRFPFATIVTKDYGEFDNASNLNREGVFRLNIGVSKETYERLFPDEVPYDFTSLDTLMPHPVYGQYHFVCVVNPSDTTFETLKPLLVEAYEIAVKRAQPRIPKKK